MSRNVENALLSKEYMFVSARQQYTINCKCFEYIPPYLYYRIFNYFLRIVTINRVKWERSVIFKRQDKWRVLRYPRNLNKEGDIIFLAKQMRIKVLVKYVIVMKAMYLENQTFLHCPLQIVKGSYKWSWLYRTAFLFVKRILKWKIELKWSQRTLDIAWCL